MADPYVKDSGWLVKSTVCIRKWQNIEVRGNLNLGHNKVAVHLWSESATKDLEFLHFILQKAVGQLCII